MSAEVVVVAPQAPAGADDVVRATIRGLAALRGQKLEDVAKGIGMPKTTMFRKLRGVGAKQEFTAGEVAAIANHFGVEVGVLFSGLGYLECPQQDSNLRHTVYSVGTLRSRGHLTLVSSASDSHEPAPAAPQRPVRHLSVVRAA